MAFQFMIPKKIFMGSNSLEAAEMAMKELGKRALIVTGKNVTKIGTVKILTDCLDKWNIDSYIYNEITGEPTIEMIEKGNALFQNAECDFIIAIGGGSPLDSGKAIAAMSVLEGQLSDYAGKEIKGSFPPMVMIPTTAGTGSETTKFTIITDTKRNVKMLLKGDSLMPDMAIIDSLFTMTTPKEITAQTGLDALTHAIESYTSRKANVLTDLYALSAIKRIFTYLPIAYRDGSNRLAREEMALAAFEAGVCINNASVTLVHGMSRPIGALFHVPHGLSNAMLLKDCLEYVLDGCYDRFAAIARAINVADNRVSDKEASRAFIRELGDLMKHCEIPTLKEYGIDHESFEKVKEKMATDAMASGSPLNTIKDVNAEDLKLIYDQLW